MLLYLIYFIFLQQQFLSKDIITLDLVNHPLVITVTIALITPAQLLCVERAVIQTV